jgi:hypothetical protein
MGLPPTPWDDQLYAQKGELYHNQAQTVTWLPDYFNQVRTQLRVATSNAIDTALAGDPNAAFLGPFVDADADTELIRYRRTCYVPPCYVPLFLAGPLTPRDAWNVVKHQIDADNNAVSCTAVVDYLRAAITLTTVNALPALALAVDPVAPLADQDLMIHRRRILEKDFPLLNTTQHSIQQNQIATQIGVLIQDNRRQQLLEEQRRQAASDKPLSNFIGPRGVQILLLNCGVMSENQLPPIWAELANATKAQQLAVLQFAIDDKKRNCAEPELQFIVNASNLQLVKNLAFELTSLTSVSSGLTPFLFFEQMEQEAYEANSTWSSLMSGAAGATTADLAPLLKSKVKPPMTDMDVRHMHRRLEVFCQVLFGDYHEIPLAINGFLTRYLSMESSINRLEMQMRQPKELRCTMICRKTSLVLSAWFRKRRLVAGQIAGPDLNRFFEDVEMDNNWEQVVPQSVLAQLGLQQQNLPRSDGGNTPLRACGGAPIGGAPGGGGGNGGGATTETGRQTGTRINNVNFVASMFQRFRDLTAVTCKMLKERIRSGVTPPLPMSKGDATKPMCLAWHSRGECNTICACKNDHVQYTNSELAPFLTWCNANFKE